MAARHSASMEARPNAGPQTCRRSTMVGHRRRNRKKGGATKGLSEVESAPEDERRTAGCRQHCARTKIRRRCPQRGPRRVYRQQAIPDRRKSSVRWVAFVSWGFKTRIHTLGRDLQGEVLASNEPRIKCTGSLPEERSSRYEDQWTLPQTAGPWCVSTRERRRWAAEASGAQNLVLRGLQTQVARVDPLLAGEL